MNFIRIASQESLFVIVHVLNVPYESEVRSQEFGLMKVYPQIDKYIKEHSKETDKINKSTYLLGYVLLI